ncbi:hypothetical protein [Tenggerimyces flavus]|uniref:Uncharacterized protein n=1 Tax=Tenggerimyces flavus TaxID=1708749 RepID=A0ABV7YIY5_9ACTN|nr:hypothetical protein [Tenggerimyces flavus]MBM7784105.1 hypothetical protein [Tenggerimyces flavus]
MTNDPRQLEPDHLPTPFTAAEIRDASPPGKTVRVLVESDGEGPYLTVTRYDSCDSEGAIRQAWQESPEGIRLSEPQEFQSAWLDLQAHASFPVATTTRDEVELDTPFGRLDCLRYVRRDGDDVDTFWFARSMPGMPVRMESATGGRVVDRRTQQSNEIHDEK